MCGQLAEWISDANPNGARVIAILRVLPTFDNRFPIRLYEELLNVLDQNNAMVATQAENKTRKTTLSQAKCEFPSENLMSI